MDRYFWERLGDAGDAIAFVDEPEREAWSYKRLSMAVADGSARLPHNRKKVIFLFANNDAGSILCYLSALMAGHLVYLAKGMVSWPDATELLEKYRPDILLWKGTDEFMPPQYESSDPLFGYQFAERGGEQRTVGKEIGLLLSTSGSMGSPKLVRLSRQNIEAGAYQVAKALKLAPGQRAITSLPMSFVFGLSVVHSHLYAGASLVLTRRSVQDRAFWQLLDETGVTSLAGVPWTFRMLRAIAFDPAHYPRLRRFSLSGGAIDPELSDWLGTLSEEGLDIFSMYGQTEATGRICVLPPELFRVKPRSVGPPMEGSQINCDADGNIIFSGPNVMLGYANSRDDLGDADSLGGTLLTGDTGYLDRDGCLYITGRTSRVAKLFGLRVNLDEIEAFLGGSSVVAASDDQQLVIFLEKTKPTGFDEKLAELLRRLRIPVHCVHVQVLTEFPRNAAGKIRYGALRGNTKQRPNVLF